MKNRNIEIGLHLLFWTICYFVLLESFAQVYIEGDLEVLKQQPRNKKVIIEKEYLYIPILLSVISKALVVYSLILYFKNYQFNYKKWKNIVLITIGILMLGVLLEFFLNYLYSILIINRPLGWISKTLKVRIFLTVFFAALSMAYIFWHNYMRNEILKQKIIQEKLMVELKFLKTQINPHFLFNTLNNLYSISEKNKYSEISNGIHELSNLMRYMLYEAKSDRVSLEKEISYLRSVIEIQQYRLSEEDDILIAFNIKGDYLDRKIAPLILVSFVENAFKHGIDANKSSFIKIDLKLEKDNLYFSLSNSNHQDQISEIKEASGIGLANVKRRLKLIYKDNYDLKVNENKETFKVKLKLPLD